MQRQGKENPKFQAMIADMAAIDRFVSTGEMTPPALPIGESEAIKESYQEAVKRIGTQFIVLLTNDRVADILLTEEPRGVSEYSLVGSPERSGNRASRRINPFPSAQDMTIALEREDGMAARVVLQTEGRNFHQADSPDVLPSLKSSGKTLEEVQAKIQTDLSSLFPHSENNDWQFSCNLGQKVTNPNRTITTSYRYSASRDLELTDLASHKFLFKGFVRGAGNLFKFVHNRIDELTLVSGEAERLQKITEAGNQAAKLMADALRS